MAIYTKYGPFSNGVPPAISQNVLNDVESALTGALGIGKCAFTTGSIARISKFSGIGSQTGVAHGCGANPDIVIIQYAGNYGAIGQAAAYKNTTSTTVDVDAAAGVSWNGLAIRFTP